MQDQEKLAIVLEGSNQIEFYSPDTLEICNKPLIITHPPLKVDTLKIKKKNGKVEFTRADIDIEIKTSVEDIIYISDHNYKLLLVASSDRFLRGYRYVGNSFIPAFSRLYDELIEKKFD